MDNVYDPGKLTLIRISYFFVSICWFIFISLLFGIDCRTKLKNACFITIGFIFSFYITFYLAYYDNFLCYRIYDVLAILFFLVYYLFFAIIFIAILLFIALLLRSAGLFLYRSCKNVSIKKGHSCTAFMLQKLTHCSGICILFFNYTHLNRFL